jgi:putative tryptophan/tyrosine transport system substrate-binding protein
VPVIDRRTFIAITGGGVLGMPFIVRAQPAGKVYRVALLVHGGQAIKGLVEVFRSSLREFGYIEGQNLQIEVRLVERHEALPDAAAELVRIGVDVIAAATTLPGLAAKRATSTIPIVLIAAADPVQAGLVAGLARPGGNVTGNAALTPELSGKLLELVREAMPKLSRIAVLWNSANPANTPVMRETVIVTNRLGMKLDLVDLRAPDQIEDSLAAIVRHRPDAVLIMPESAFFAHVLRINDVAIRHRFPTIALLREFARRGSLMSYGPSIPDLVKRSAAFVDKILRGANPASLPIEQPTKFELVINLKTCSALGLTMPETLLVRADELIQ